jgi:hypothetical protein
MVRALVTPARSPCRCLPADSGAGGGQEQVSLPPSDQ